MLVHSRVYLDALVVGERQRPVDPERVDALAKSMSEIGLQQPISIWAEKDDIEGAPDTLHVIAGAHRVRAAEQLGWEQIDALYLDLDDIDRRRWEIAENLHRAELTALQRDEQVSQWVQLTEHKRQRDAEKVRQLGALKQPGQGRGSEGGVRAAARELGMKETSVRRAVNIAEKLTPDAKELAREYGLDKNQSALERIARSVDQVAEVQRIEDERVQREREKAERQKRKREQAAAEPLSGPPEIVVPEPKPQSVSPETTVEPIVGETCDVSPAELSKVRSLSDADLSTLITEIDTHGWESAKRTLRMMAAA